MAQREREERRGLHLDCVKKSDEHTDSLSRHFLVVGKTMPEDITEVEARGGANQAAEKEHLSATKKTE